jgi:hypothetical protein
MCFVVSFWWKDLLRKANYLHLDILDSFFLKECCAWKVSVTIFVLISYLLQVIIPQSYKHLCLISIRSVVMWLHCKINFNFVYYVMGIFMFSYWRVVRLLSWTSWIFMAIIKLQHISGFEFRFLLDLEKELSQRYHLFFIFILYFTWSSIS